MKKTFLTGGLPLLALCLLLWNCYDDSLIQPKEERLGHRYKVPEVSAVRPHYDRTTHKKNPFKNDKGLFSKTEDEIAIAWEYSSPVEYNPEEGLDVLYTPVYYEKYGVRKKTFLASVESEEGIETEVITLFYADNSDAYKFSGFILIHYLTGEMKQAYRYIDGEKVFEFVQYAPYDSSSYGAFSHRSFSDLNMMMIPTWLPLAMSPPPQSSSGDCGIPLDESFNPDTDVVQLATVLIGDWDDCDTSDDGTNDTGDDQYDPDNYYRTWTYPGNNIFGAGVYGNYNGNSPIGTSGGGIDYSATGINEDDPGEPVKFWWQEEGDCPPGFIRGYNPEEEAQDCYRKPCKGDPVSEPEIAPQLGPSGMDGALFGTCTRKGKKCPGNPDIGIHDGVDIKNPYGAPIFAMYDGVATIATQFSNITGEIAGAGYHVSVMSIVNGQQVRLVYFHLQEDNRAVGEVHAGDIIGYQGVSGNLGVAIEKKNTTSHVHVKARLNGLPTDPLNYLNTTIDPVTGQVTNPCQ